MGRNIDDVIKGLPAPRRKRIAAEAQRLAEEMMREADSLAAMRKATGRTQAELAEALGITQHAVSQIERRTDLYVSTLQRYFEALGYKLELTLVTPDDERVSLESFLPWHQPMAQRPRRVSAVVKPPALRGKA